MSKRKNKKETKRNMSKQIAIKNDFGLIIYLILGLVIVVVPSIYSAKVLDNTLMPRFVATAIFVSLFIVYYFINFKNNLTSYEFSIFKKPTFIIYVVFLILTLVSYTYSINKSEAIFDFLKIFTFFALFALLSLFFTKNKDTSKEITQLFVVFSLIISLTGLANIYELVDANGFNNIRKVIYGIRGNFAHKNLFSQSLLITLGFTIYGFVTLKHNFWKIASAIASVFSIVLIVFFLSRAVWVSFFVASLFSIIIYLLFVNKKEALPKRLLSAGKIAGIIVAIIALSAIIYTVSGDKNSIVNHVKKGTDFKSGSTYHRFELWEKSSGVIKDNFIIGVGAANWKTVVLKYGIGEQTAKGWKYPVRPHNDYLWILAELGIIGLLAFLAIFGTIFYFLFQLFRKSDNENQKLFSLALFFGLVAYMCFSFFSFPKERIESQVFLHLIFAYIVANYHNLTKKEANTKTGNKFIVASIAVVSLIIMSVAIFAGIQRVNTEKKLQTILAMQKKNKLNLAVPHAIEANKTFATLDHAGLPIYWYEGVGLVLQKKLEEGKKVLLKAHEVHPYHSVVIKVLADVANSEGEIDLAKSYYNKALKIHPDDKNVLKKLAGIYSKTDKDSVYPTLNLIAPELNKKKKKKNKDKQYRKMMIAELMLKVQALSDTSDTKAVKKLIVSKHNDRKWLFNLYYENWEIGLNFEKLFLETIIKEAEEAKLNKKSINQLNEKLRIRN